MSCFFSNQSSGTVQTGQPDSVAHSSRGLGHLPLKEEITGSNPVCATKEMRGTDFKSVPSPLTYSVSHLISVTLLMFINGWMGEEW